MLLDYIRVVLIVIVIVIVVIVCCAHWYKYVIGASSDLLLSTHVLTYHLVLISHPLLALVNVIACPKAMALMFYRALTAYVRSCDTCARNKVV